jgi:hypothetical protein
VPSRHLSDVERAWPAIILRRVRRAVGEQAFSDEMAQFRLLSGLDVTVSRRERVARFSGDDGPQDLVTHPLLAAVGAVFAHWDGREALHGGAFLSQGRRAWTLLAPKAGGKSTTLAALHRAGAPVLTDDLVVCGDGLAFSGPRCVEVPDEACAALGLRGSPARPGKSRLPLGPGPPAAELGGIVLLAWGDTARMAPIGARERVGRIGAHRTVRMPAASPALLLDLVALPALELSRPPGLASLERVVSLLLTLE